MITTPAAGAPAHVVVNSHAAVSYTLKIVNTSDSSETHAVTLYENWPTIGVPRRNGYVFMGYYTQRNGEGLCVVNEKGRRVYGDRLWLLHSDLTLYACWRSAYVGRNFVVNDAETLVVDELVSEDELVQPGEGHLFDVRPGGTLILRNRTIRGTDGAMNGVIFNMGKVVVSNCVFESCNCVYGAGGVYIDRFGAKALFERCTFRGNSAHEGGCIVAEGSYVSLVYCTFVENFVYANDTPGGSVACAFDGARLNLVSCTCVSNLDASVKGPNRSFRFGNLSEDYAIINNVHVFSPTNGLETLDSWNDTDVTNKLTESYSIRTTDASSCLGKRVTRVTAGDVRQESYRPVGRARTDGCATKLWMSPDFGGTYGAGLRPEGATPIEADQFGQYPLDGYCGARTGNTLQHLIDITPAGGTLEAPVDVYEPVKVAKKVRVTVADGERAEIDGFESEPCVTLLEGAEEASWDGFFFRHGWAVNGGGVSWQGSSETGGVVSNCVFADNVATNCGGAVARLAAAHACVFSNNVAAVEGGGTYAVGCVDRSLYYGNRAGNGGASAYDVLQTSLLRNNVATGDGGGIYASEVYNCTLAANTSKGAGTVAAGPGARVYASFLYPKTGTVASNVRTESTFKVDSTPFADAARGDFRLARSKLKRYSSTEYEKVDQSAYRVTSSISLDNARQGWLDMLGAPILSRRILTDPATETAVTNEYLYAGCYAYAPYKQNGLVVTGTEDYYRNSSTECSLREAVEEAESDPFYRNANGECVVTFAPELFEWGSAIFPSSSFQIQITGFTNSTLVIRGPENDVVIFDGGSEHRAFHVAAKNSLRMENVYFRNFFGEPLNGLSSDGGAVLNDGNLFVSNCTFTANMAGNNVWSSDYTAGNGGAIATRAGGVTTAYGTTFEGNRAVKGGALYAAAGGTNRVFFSTLARNTADGTSGLSGASPVGGAVAAADAKPYPVTWLVNATVADNDVVKASDVATAGGGVQATEGLLALNSIIVGNRVNGETNDVGVAGGGTAKFYLTAYGARTPTNKVAHALKQVKYVDVVSRGGYDTRDLLAKPTDAYSRTTNMVHYVIPMAGMAVYDVPATNVWVSADYANVGMGGTNRCSTLIAGTKLSALLRGGHLLNSDQTGTAGAAGRLGATLQVSASLWDSHIYGSEGGTGEEELGEDEVPLSAARYVIVTPTAVTNGYASLEMVTRHYRWGDSICVTETNDTEQAVVDLIDGFYEKFSDYYDVRDWYTGTWADDFSRFTASLNAKAVPTVCAFDVTGADKVSVRLSNVKPGLWYSLGYAPGELSAGFTFSTWVEADDTGVLKDFLTAPKVSEKANFYKVTVLPYKP